MARGGGPPLSFSASASVTHPWRLRLMTRLQRLSLLGFICAFTLFSSVVSAEGANQGSNNGDHALTTRVVAPWRSHECAVVAEAAEHAAASGLFWEYLGIVYMSSSILLVRRAGASAMTPKSLQIGHLMILLRDSPLRLATRFVGLRSMRARMHRHRAAERALGCSRSSPRSRRR